MVDGSVARVDGVSHADDANSAGFVSRGTATLSRIARAAEFSREKTTPEIGS